MYTLNKSAKSAFYILVNILLVSTSMRTDSILALLKLLTECMAASTTNDESPLHQDSHQVSVDVCDTRSKCTLLTMLGHYIW